MPSSVEVVGLEDRERWEAEHGAGGLPSQSWQYAWGISASGVEPQLAVVRAGGARMLVPYFERRWHGSTDVATIRCLSGASIDPPSPAPLAAWREFAAAQGWVAGYVQLAPSSRVEPNLVPDEDVTRANAVFLLDLEGRDVLASASQTIRQKVKRADSLGCVLTTDREQLGEALSRLYPAAMGRARASQQTSFTAETLRRWAQAPTSVVVGASVDDAIEAVAVFPTSSGEAEYHLNAATTAGRELAAWLLGHAVGRLRRIGVRLLNLGGGVSPGDGVYRFKERFHGEERPLLAVRQIYNPDAYERLCSESGVEPGGTVRFPAYRYAEDA